MIDYAAWCGVTDQAGLKRCQRAMRGLLNTGLVVRGDSFFTDVSPRRVRLTTTGKAALRQHEATSGERAHA
jgi:hypothetical protein